MGIKKILYRVEARFINAEIRFLCVLYRSTI